MVRVNSEVGNHDTYNTYWHMTFSLLRHRRAYHSVQWIRNATKFLMWHRKHFNFIFHLVFFRCSHSSCMSDIFLFVWSFLHFFLSFSKLNAPNCTRQIVDTGILQGDERNQKWKMLGRSGARATYSKSKYANRYPYPYLHFAFLPPTSFYRYYYYYYYCIRDASKK